MIQNGNEIFLGLAPEQLLALAAYGEAASEGGEGMMAVLNVIINRANYPDTYADADILYSGYNVWYAVTLKPKQFSAFNIGDPVRQKLVNFANDFQGSTLSNTVLGQAYNLAQMAVMGTLQDNTGGATNYHATSILPPWAGTMDKIGQIGNHIFYSALPVAQRIRQYVGIAVQSPITYIIIAGLAFVAYKILKKR